MPKHIYITEEEKRFLDVLGGLIDIEELDASEVTLRDMQKALEVPLHVAQQLLDGLVQTGILSLHSQRIHLREEFLFIIQ